MEDLDLARQRRAGQIRQQTELQRLRDALALLVRCVRVTGEIAHLVITPGKRLEADEREGELGAAAGRLCGDQHMHLRVLAVDHVVQIRDLLAQVVVVAAPAVEEDPQCLVGRRLGLDGLVRRRCRRSWREPKPPLLGLAGRLDTEPELPAAGKEIPRQRCL